MSHMAQSELHSMALTEDVLYLSGRKLSRFPRFSYRSTSGCASMRSASSCVALFSDSAVTELPTPAPGEPLQFCQFRHPSEIADYRQPLQPMMLSSADMLARCTGWRGAREH